MKTIRWLLLLILLIVCRKEVSAESINMPQYSWWAYEKFIPKDKMIESIPIKNLNPQWAKASRLDVKLLSKTGKEYFKKISKENAFSFYGDFNNDGKKDKAIVGVYENNAGTRGNFLIILTYENHKWRKIFLHEFSGDSEFIVLHYTKNDLDVCFCFECDGCIHVVWSSNNFTLKSWDDDFNVEYTDNCTK